MSATQETGPAIDKAVSGHDLEKLVELIKPCMTRIVKYAVEDRILGAGGEKLSAYCESLDKLYVMTSRGLAKQVRLAGTFKKPPKLLGRDDYPAIGAHDRRSIYGKLVALLEKHNRAFPTYAVRIA